MIDMFIVLIILLLVLLYILALMGRIGFTDFKDFKPFLFTHRGLYGRGIPENSISAFKRAVENGYGAEFDVHLTADGDLVVIHDHSLKRTAGVELQVEELTLKEIKKFNLENTDQLIPSFKEVLDVFGGKYPLIIELKNTKNNVPELCSTVVSQLEHYNGAYCVESFDPRCVLWFKKNHPQIIRGQLSENYFKSKNSKLSFFIKFAMTFLLTNFINKPDFVAFRFEHRNNISFKICTKLLKMQGVWWTIRKREDIEIALKENIIPIFEETK